MHGGAPGNCVLTARRIVAIYPSSLVLPTNVAIFFDTFPPPPPTAPFLFSLSVFNGWFDRSQSIARPVVYFVREGEGY